MLIVGAGPAGSIAALELARAGLDVTVVEKGRPLREKVCGDALIPDSLAVLRRLGLLERVEQNAQPTRAIRLYSPSARPVDVEGVCLCLVRGRLDSILIEAAQEAGAQLLTETEALSYTAKKETAEVQVRSNGRLLTLRASLVMLASGASSKVLAAFGVDHRSTPSAIALRTYYRLRPEVTQDLLHIWFERPLSEGYAWIFPVGDHVFNVGAGVFRTEGRRRPNLRVIFDRFRSDCKAASEMLAGGQLLGRVQGAPLRTDLHGADLCRDRLLVVGEAIGSTFAFSGEGIGKAMETASMAAKVALEAVETGRFGANDLAQYESEVRSSLQSKFRHYTLAQRWLRYPVLLNLIAWRASRSHKLRSLLSDILNERRSPTEVLSASGLFKAAFSR